MPKKKRQTSMVPLVVKEIPVDKNNKHPPPPNTILPEHEFSCGLIAPKGAGKTTLICNILMYYKKYFHNIFVFSPTVKNDEKWQWIKKQPLLVENKALVDIVNKIEKETKKFHSNPIVGEPFEHTTKAPSMKKDKFTGLIPNHNFLDKYKEDDLAAILDEQQQMIDFLEEHGYSKHVANRILYVFDDPVGTDLYTSRRQDLFKEFNCAHRHTSASMLEVSQGYKEIPKTIRNNFSCLIIFEICNDAELEVIMKEYPMGLKREQWMEAYKYCMEGNDWNFMFYNMQKPKSERIMKNFTEILSFQ